MDTKGITKGKAPGRGFGSDPARRVEFEWRQATQALTVGPPRVLVLRAGFAGLWAARALSRAPADVLLVDRNNYHTFQPLLYQVAAAELGPEAIAQPVRSLSRGLPNVHFARAEVGALDLAGRTVQTSNGVLGYDYLLLALGSGLRFSG